MSLGNKFQFATSTKIGLSLVCSLFLPSLVALATEHSAPATTKIAAARPAAGPSKKAPDTTSEKELEAPILATIDKTHQYLDHETLAGGQAPEEQIITLNTVRRSVSANGDYERLVLDFKNSRSGDVGLAPSYFSIRKRKISNKDYLQIQISGAKVDDQAQDSLQKAYRKPGLFSSNPQLIPLPANANELILMLELKPQVKFEAFQLSNHGRIVLDLKG